MSDTEIASIEQDMAADIDGYFKDTAKVERYGQLIEAKESGAPAPAGPSTNQQRKAELEKMMAEPGNSSPYWHDEKLQAEYRNLMQGGLPFVDVPSAESDQVAEAQERVDSAFDGIDIAELDSAFTGLPDTLQQGIAQVLADPSRRQDVLLSLPESDVGELEHFLESMTEDEFEATKRALFI